MASSRSVLILVVVEYEFVGCRAKGYNQLASGLNPCCSGIWIRRQGTSSIATWYQVVLILVVVEYEFVEDLIVVNSNATSEVLILVVVEYEFVGSV